jgi:AraC family transcriptional regulator
LVLWRLRQSTESDKRLQTGIVEIDSPHAVTRRAAAWRGISAELIQAVGRERMQVQYRGPRHLLIIHERGERLQGETILEGVPPSSLRDMTQKLTFVPAGYDYRDWQEPRVLARTLYVYFDPAEIPIDATRHGGTAVLAPRLLFRDAMLWDSAVKLAASIDAAEAGKSRYCEALGVLLAHEIVRLHSGKPPVQPQARGGLAAWQKRAVTSYVDEHLAERIPLAKLAELARLSPFYFCRAFKQSFGVPPHRYHNSRRIERAKALLAEHEYSVTNIGLELGFSETSSFTSAFRKVTGLTPTAFHRSLA